MSDLRGTCWTDSSLYGRVVQVQNNVQDYTNDFVEVVNIEHPWRLNVGRRSTLRVNTLFRRFRRSTAHEGASDD
jgi:hypothetical protein